MSAKLFLLPHAAVGGAGPGDTLCSLLTTLVKDVESSLTIDLPLLVAFSTLFSFSFLEAFVVLLDEVF